MSCELIRAVVAWQRSRDVDDPRLIQAAAAQGILTAEDRERFGP
jgi:hypothetical protein